jgi:hypothetical protein
MSGPDISIISESDDEVTLPIDLERVEVDWMQVLISSEPVSSVATAVGIFPQDAKRIARVVIAIKNNK